MRSSGAFAASLGACSAEANSVPRLPSTPITPSSYLTGKLRGLIAYLLPLLLVPIGTLAVAGIYVLVGLAGGSSKVQLKEPITAATPCWASSVRHQSVELFTATP